MAPIRCFLVDDDHFVRIGLAAELEAIEGVDLIGSAADLDAALCGAVPDVVLLDLGLQTSCRRTATQIVLSTWPEARVLIITAFATPPDLMQAFAEGARGYLTKSVGPRELAEAIRTVAAGGTYVSPTHAGHLLNAELRLTAGERAVLRRVAEGRTDKQVAAVLQVSQKAVENRLASVRMKAGLADRSRSLITRFALDCDPYCQLTPDQHDEEEWLRPRRRARLVRRSSDTR